MQCTLIIQNHLSRGLRSFIRASLYMLFKFAGTPLDQIAAIFSNQRPPEHRCNFYRFQRARFNIENFGKRFMGRPGAGSLRASCLSGQVLHTEGQSELAVGDHLQFEKSTFTTLKPEKSFNAHHLQETVWAPESPGPTATHSSPSPSRVYEVGMTAAVHAANGGAGDTSM